MSRRREQGKGAARAEPVQVVNHQSDRLALFLDAAPGHQLSQCLAGSGHAMQPDFFLAASLSPRRESFASPQSLLIGLSARLP